MQSIERQFIEAATSQSIFEKRPALLIDVRSENEFLQDELPLSVNLPILNNDERHRVGLEFKNEGRQRALDLGHKLVAGEIRKSREVSWMTAIESGARFITCWRGGLRSKITQDWLRDRGADLPRLELGTKGIRNFCLELLDRDFGPSLVVRGRTGSGKTRFLNELVHRISGYGFLDLEACANHRGSAFGKSFDSVQPQQASFENRVAFELYRLRRQNLEVLVEGESRSIGKNILPTPLFSKMKECSFIYLNKSLEERVNYIFDEYIRKPLSAGLSTADLRTYYLSALMSVQQKLGGLRYREVFGIIEKSFADGASSLHKEWIEKLLVYYYDRLYDYSHEQLKDRMIFQGSEDDAINFLSKRKKNYAYG